MSMSTHVIGIKPPDALWQQMKTIWDACRAAGIDPPTKVEEFFDGYDPDPLGVRVELEGTPAVREWSDDAREGFEVDVRSLPPDVTVIRFYNSW